jgi:hypothetical protein
MAFRGTIPGNCILLRWILRTGFDHFFAGFVVACPDTDREFELLFRREKFYLADLGHVEFQAAAGIVGRRGWGRLDGT